MKMPHLSEEEIESTAAGLNSDPFRTLGPHLLPQGLAVRAFYPEALSVELLAEGQGPIPMERLHDAGFYAVLLPGVAEHIRYQLRVTYQETAVVCEDAYRFPPAFSQFDTYLLAEGTHLHIYEKLGAHPAELDGVSGTLFAVWAPSALRVSVVGDFNQWDGRRHPMRFYHGSGVWELFIPGLTDGTLYKYEVRTRYQEYTVLKSDPVGFAAEMRPQTGSLVWDIEKYRWGDHDWMASRPRRNGLDAPISVYELHLGSWRLKDGTYWLTYRELIDQLIPYVLEMGFTHIELLPVSEHPFDGSWGYQVTGYFAVTSRFGSPDDFMAFVDACHQAGIGVILDWVPAHFPTDEHGLGFFDGTHLYEHADPRQGTQPDWGTLVFNYGRSEVAQFLISNAIFWLQKYHIDALRVDAVASMLYLDFSREGGEWVPNRDGGRENLEAIRFLKNLNDRVHELFPDVLMIAEESTAWAGVTRPTAQGGLGFDLKWNMGWMHDSLKYMKHDPIHRAFHHGTLTFSLLYAFDEKFLLPFSHDEVVHLKKSMLDKMPGDNWRRFANLRLLYGYQWAHPGKKLLFMGGEFGQWREWSEARSLDWELLDGVDAGLHQGLQRFTAELNQLYRAQPALYQEDYSWEGFTWLDFQDSQRSLLAFARHAPESGATVLVACNFTPVVRENYRLGVPEPGVYREILNSDAGQFGGSGVINEGDFLAAEEPADQQPYAIRITLPPLGVTFFKRVDQE